MFQISSLKFVNQTDLIAEKNESAWTPETGYSQNAIPFDLPWRVTGNTADNSVRLLFDFKETNFKGKHCRKSNSGLTVI